MLSFVVLDSVDPCYVSTLAIPAATVRIIDDELADPIQVSVNLSQGKVVNTPIGMTLDFPAGSRVGGGSESLTVQQMSVRQMTNPPPPLAAGFGFAPLGPSQF